ncbi:MAG: DUF192 domain-containing protein [Hyphomicrobiaceae bacterium]
MDVSRARVTARQRAHNFSDRAALMAALFCFALVGVMSSGSFHLAAEPSSEKTEVLWLETEAGPAHKIHVEVARTMAEKSRGLMFRTSLAPDRGMLFPYKEAGNHAMWMRNTYIPLDMVFIKSNGRVHRIEAKTEPFSETIISAGAPVTGVLELAGGMAAKLGLKAGDLVRHSWFGTAKDSD